MEKGRSWIATLVAQVFLCGALYVALNLGQPQKSNHQNRSGSGRPHDVYFISVRGGFRPLERQTHLLKQMEKVAKTYKARFVVNISEQGEDDPLAQNASSLFSHLGIQWYNTSQLQPLPVFSISVFVPAIFLVSI
uniref:Uncharacterized protein MANES_14G112000 n=1 Tax=Rhizophora mucronata TaxID=61149 RepID=A0A2P2KIE7_RHIMU